MKPSSSIFAVLTLAVALVVVPALFASEDEGFIPVDGPCSVHFPQDHGSHPGYRTEWWYYTGNLKTAGSEHFGFQLTFFRRQMSPTARESAWPAAHSRWRTNQILLAHAALTDVAAKKFHHSERMSRWALEMAGAYSDEDATVVFMRNWLARISPSEHTLRADTGDFAFDLRLVPAKPPVLHGDSGYSRKGRNAASASCYYSITRLEVSGSVIVNGSTFPVTGNAWMDHEYSSAPLEPDLSGWDWFGLQLSDKSDLMVYILRERDGSFSTASGGTFVDASGKTIHLGAEDIRARPTAFWSSHDSGARYPTRWDLRILPLGLDLSISPRVAGQEQQTLGTTGITYWEGSVEASGTAGTKQIDGEGYMELTGYDHPLDDRF